MQCRTCDEELRAFFEFSHNFSDHEEVFIGRDDGTRMPFFAFVHDIRRGSRRAGWRVRQYASMADFVSERPPTVEGNDAEERPRGTQLG